MSNSKPLLHIVMASGKFHNVNGLVEHAKTLLGSVPSGQSGVILYPETPFDCGLQTPTQVQAEVGKLSAEIGKHSPNTAVMFSVHEQMPKGLANTGYIVHSSGHESYWKYERAAADDVLAEKLGSDSFQTAIDDWEERKTLTAGPEGINARFPEHEFPSGHGIQYRVCLDANLKPELGMGGIVLVSAFKIPKFAFQRISSMAKLLVVNDSYTHRGPFIAYTQDGKPELHQLVAGSPSFTSKRLESLGVKIHYPKPAP
jgi:hypothetical protein